MGLKDKFKGFFVKKSPREMRQEKRKKDVYQSAREQEEMVIAREEGKKRARGGRFWKIKEQVKDFKKGRKQKVVYVQKWKKGKSRKQKIVYVQKGKKGKKTKKKKIVQYVEKTPKGKPLDLFSSEPFQDKKVGMFGGGNPSKYFGKSKGSKNPLEI